jgi:hypothetical protein
MIDLTLMSTNQQLVWIEILSESAKANEGIFHLN